MKNRAQSSIEFSLAFICTILFLIFACNIFVWMGHCLVARQNEYEKSSIVATKSDPGKQDFFTPPELNVFHAGGYK